ncbi:MAG: transposase [Parabacteroides sp.]|nr:transposase [Parabacteroides sp.]
MDVGGQETAIYTLGWFYEFKLHLIIIDNGEILNFMFITGAVMIRYAKYVGTSQKKR